MLKNYRKFLMAGIVTLGLAACGDDLTITDPVQPPETSNITSFSVSPTSATVAPGTFVQASANLVTIAGVTGSVAWTSSNAAVATVDGSGRIDAISEGTAVVTATATAGGQTATAAIGVTVRPIEPAQISIQSVTTGATNIPVNISNVMGQIEINMNFNPGEELVDSVAVFIGNKRAAKQAFATSPSAGPISLSVNTANYVKDVAAGTAAVDYQNGATTISAAVYPRGAAATATNTIQIVLNNTDGWAADLTKPVQTANSAGGLTYWGGPGADGLTEVTLYPVVYTPGRTVAKVNIAPAAGCASTQFTAMPFRATFGYTADGADFACNYEWNGGSRDNARAIGAIDNTNNAYPSTPLIPNTVVLGSTPDSLRFDWVGPSVTTPLLDRTEPAVKGWVNKSFPFAANQSDAGVGVASSTGTSIFYNAPNCGDGLSEDNPVPSKTGEDIPECADNFIGGTPGLAGTAPYQVYATGEDRLGNGDNSGLSDFFGVDKTVPQIRWGIVSAAPALVASITADTIFSAAGLKPAGVGIDEWRAEYIDERSGFYNNGTPIVISGDTVAAQSYAVSTAGHVNNAGACIIGSGTPGAAFVTDPTCGMVAIGTGGPIRVDGWQAGMSFPVPLDEGYYGYATKVVDAAGNSSAVLSQKSLVNVESPFATGLGVPATLTSGVMGFFATTADSAEVIAHSLSLTYPNLPVPEVRYSAVEVGTTFDDVITSPFGGNVAPPTGMPYVIRIEAVTGDAWDGVTVPVPSNIDAAGLDPADLATVKPTGVMAWSWNTGSMIAGGPLPGVSPLIAIPALLVADGVDIADWNVANPTIAANYWRVITTVATTNQFNSTDPLRAQAVAPTNSPNPPFVRVDFYRLDAGGTWYNYLGSDATAVPADQGSFRSWVWSMPNGSYVQAWDNADQADVAAADVIIAVGVTSTGEGITTVPTTMIP